MIPRYWNNINGDFSKPQEINQIGRFNFFGDTPTENDSAFKIPNSYNRYSFQQIQQNVSDINSYVESKEARYTEWLEIFGNFFQIPE